MVADCTSFLILADKDVNLREADLFYICRIGAFCFDEENESFGDIIGQGANVFVLKRACFDSSFLYLEYNLLPDA